MAASKATEVLSREDCSNLVQNIVATAMWLILLSFVLHFSQPSPGVLDILVSLASWSFRQCTVRLKNLFVHSAFFSLQRGLECWEVLCSC